MGVGSFLRATFGMWFGYPDWRVTPRGEAGGRRLGDECWKERRNKVGRFVNGKGWIRSGGQSADPVGGNRRFLEVPEIAQGQTLPRGTSDGRLLKATRRTSFTWFSSKIVATETINRRFGFEVTLSDSL
jgi:hypothetical protein